MENTEVVKTRRKSVVLLGDDSSLQIQIENMDAHEGSFIDLSRDEAKALADKINEWLNEKQH